MKISINGNDISKYVIVHSSNITETEQTAVNELINYVNKTCGVTLNDCTYCGGQYEIVIGNDKRFGYDGFRIHTNGDKLYITGGRPRGVLYGVYEFLEKYIGWRFLTEEVEYLKDLGNVNIADIDDEQMPILEHRDVYWYSYFKTGIAVKRKINSANTRKIPESMGGSIGYAGSFFVHTLEKLVGCAWTEQPCLTDPAILAKTIESVRAILKETPDAKIISVSQNDNQNYCKCERCAAVDEEEGSHAGTMIRFVNAVADEFAADYPELAIHTLAYQYTRKAPIIVKPRDNVIIQLCSIECCFNHPLSDDSCELNKAFIYDMVEWAKICNRIYIWDYTTNFTHYIATFPNLHVIADNVKFFVDNNSKGIFEQGNYNAPSGEFGDLRPYLLAKLLWNPYMSEAEFNIHMDDFGIGYYGASWEYIRKFIDYITECAKKVPHFGIFDQPAKMLPVEEYLSNTEIDEWFDKAESLTTGVMLENVKRVRLQHTYFKMGNEFEKYSREEVEAFRDALVHFDIKKDEWGKRTCVDADVTVSPFTW